MIYIKEIYRYLAIANCEDVHRSSHGELDGHAIGHPHHGHLSLTMVITIASMLRNKLQFLVSW